MERFFSVKMPFSTFLQNVLFVSLLALALTLLAYVLLSPGFLSLLVGDSTALARFMRQVATNGLTVVVVTNYVGFFIFALSQDVWAKTRDPVLNAVADVVIRAVLFIGIHAVIYVASADWFGSFGGSRSTAIRVVAPTLERSAYFENISGAYLYAVFLSALPLYIYWMRRSILTKRVAEGSARKALCYLTAMVFVAMGLISVTALSFLMAATLN